jgi:methylthioribose-1-phosphate isomerase
VSSFETLSWRDGTLSLLDQRRLPRVEERIACRTAAEAADAIRAMVVRGAPAVGVTGAYGVALSALEHARAGGDGRALLPRMASDLALLREARPTAVNLAWAVDRVTARLQAAADRLDAGDLAALAVEEARALHEEDVATNRRLGAHGAALVPDRATILTHCNAGALATAGYGTALGVVRAACEAGKRVAVIADETRPFLQGARLTAWELARDDIPVTLIADVAAASLLRAGDVDLVVVGADRIAANGDVANKVGTYPLALAARAHAVPFYVAAPLSTVDLTMPDGAAIPIEERGADEVLALGGVPIAPEGVGARNPAFDVTPADLVTAVVTEAGVLRPPDSESLRRAVEGAGRP